MRLRAGLAVLGLACAALPAGAAPFSPAIYGNVRYIQEADDTVGMELRIHPGAHPWIDLVLCEGECAHQTRTPITPVPGGFRFDYHETLAGPDGKPAPDIIHFMATYRGRNLIVRATDGSPDKLRPLRKPVALQ